MSATKQPPGEMKCELVPKTQEEDILLPCNHLADGTGAFRKTQYLKEDMEAAVAVAPQLQLTSSTEYQEMLDVFAAIQGKILQIRALTRKQKERLRRFCGGNDAAHDQRFSMPIQCTDGTADQAERLLSSALRSAVEVPLPPTSLASRGASPEDRDLVDSLTKLSVKFPPGADSEYEFLTSAPEPHIDLALARKRPLSSIAGALTEELPAELAVPFVYTAPSSHSTPSSLSQEVVRGPQQPLWRPELSNAADVGTELQVVQSSSPDKCAFCHAVVPRERMNSHLYSHFSAKHEARN
ncbi:TRAF family member-associated NF-kappa-B activator isoform X2 [Genypterus blacodes]